MTQENLSQILLEQMNLLGSTHNLTSSSPICRLELPSIVKLRLTEKSGFANMSPPPDKLFDFNWEAFKTLDDAQQKHPTLPVSGGFPKDIYQWINSQRPIIFDFQNLGTLVIHHGVSGSKSTLLEYTLANWFIYASSIELWGEHGKWTRFHERLMKLFNQYNLLVEQSYPGFYRLDPKTNWIASQGFVGELLPNELQLTLPWDFPLSALVKLEKLFLEN